MTDDAKPLNFVAAEGGATHEKPPALLSMFAQGIYNIPYKSLLFLFVLFIFITSDIFNATILKKINGTINSEQDCATPYGTVIQGILLVIGYAILNFLISHEII
jgi:hypothetical protein